MTDFGVAPLARRWTERDLRRAAGQLCSQLGQRFNGGSDAAASNIKGFITERRLSCWAGRPLCICQEKIRPKRTYGDSGNYKNSISQDVFIVNSARAKPCVLARIHQPFSITPSANN